ncbi:3-hydroxyisobutyryl-CoA hydrolase 1 [Citrus sinensis]|nr:3-hydroxyisobutyryl-CoA hydrolase 1 [Citrus sinensis]
MQLVLKVSILNGIVMGGGAGVSIHGRFRVATENSVFAMPETALGLFPDIGASYFLSRLPGFFGEYVGLTGARLDGAEMRACGLATHFVPSSRLALLEEALYKVNSSDPAVISAVIDKFSLEPYLKDHSAYHWMDVIDKCFSRRTVEEILSALESESTNRADAWISDAIQSLKKASPTSLKISLRSIREGRLQGVGQCLIREYRMVCHVMMGEVSKDFFEGCRAILLDKDKNPKWKPSKLELVNDNMVDQYFSKINDDRWEDIKLPARSNLPATAIAKL